VTFYFIRRHRLRAFPRGLGYTLLHSGEAGMSPAELRALPVRASAPAVGQLRRARVFAWLA